MRLSSGVRALEILRLLRLLVFVHSYYNLLSAMQRTHHTYSLCSEHWPAIHVL